MSEQSAVVVAVVVFVDLLDVVVVVVAVVTFFVVPLALASAVASVLVPAFVAAAVVLQAVDDVAVLDAVEAAAQCGSLRQRFVSVVQTVHLFWIDEALSIELLHPVLGHLLMDLNFNSGRTEMEE